MYFAGKLVYIIVRASNQLAVTTQIISEINGLPYMVSIYNNRSIYTQSCRANMTLINVSSVTLVVYEVFHLHIGLK